MILGVVLPPLLYSATLGFSVSSFFRKLGSILGMNVGVPGEGSIHAFWITIGVMLSVLTGMILWFRKRGWL